MIQWRNLQQVDQLQEIKSASFLKPQVIFKHSTRCSISTMVLNRLNSGDHPQNVDFYFLDLIAFREVSNAVAEFFGVHHESPQAILIKNGEVVFEESHHAIYLDELLEMAG